MLLNESAQCGRYVVQLDDGEVPVVSHGARRRRARLCEPTSSGPAVDVD